ncbi:hypothetical protein DOTSEDRAFT_87067 [Dothistroma septosporum NZE10]|uniref:N-acetyltransferase domain-containing protein n=1 Tax=Dothistroma septosporum (strain NZE10 / CBS 128990) TaxID=675120 RepID=N1PVU5_DOTSN|nr:hypothetical protein DOTSEDRAFT_87067 [Dothistroma septosporum NZE10]
MMKPFNVDEYLSWGQNWSDSGKPADDNHNSPAIQHSASQHSASSVDWEVCCFCMRPNQQGIGLSIQLLEVLTNHIKGFGAKRLMIHPYIEETVDFWPPMGFKVIAAAAGVLAKGSAFKPGTPGLLGHFHSATAAKML